MGQYYFPQLLPCILLVSCLQNSLSIPLYGDPEEFNCPVGRKIESSEVTESGRLIDLAKAEGNKIRIRFYTPTNARALAENPEETTLGFPFFISRTNDTSAYNSVIPITRKRVVSSGEDEGTTTVIPTTNFPRRLRNVFCQWEFKAANESDYLILTFNNLSAPYSVDCSEAYVALQKEDGYESRWCGNRRQQLHELAILAFSLRNINGKLPPNVTIFQEWSQNPGSTEGECTTVPSNRLYRHSGICGLVSNQWG